MRTGHSHVLLSKEEARELRICQTVISTAIHPDTGNYISWPFRFSSFMAMNMPIAFGMIFTAPTPVNTIFWQWFNQTYNAALNYENRNASSKYTTNDIMVSYFMATASAITVGLGMRKMFASRTANLKGGKLFFMNALSSFFAISAGGFLNAFFMRRTEIDKGIDVMDPQTGESLGKSRNCAKKAVLQTAISRVALVFPIFIPPTIYTLLESANLMPKYRPFSIGIELSLLVVHLYCAVPLGLASFPQRGTIGVSELEPEFQNLKNAKGESITEFSFNRGL